MRSGKIVDLRGGTNAPKRASQPSINFAASQGRTPLRVRRRRVKLAIALCIFLAIAVLIFGVSYVSYLPQLSVQRVAVSGTKTVDREEIENFAEDLLGSSRTFLSRRNIFLYPRQAIEKEVTATFPRIKSAHASRASLMATTLDIRIEEREEYALWCLTPQADASDTSQCYQMDQDGFIFAPLDLASTSLSSVYIFSGGLSTSTSEELVGRVFAEGHLPGLLALLTQLGQAGFAAKGLTVESDQDISVPLTRGYYLKASYGQDAGALTRNLQLILNSDALKGKESEIEYIDLRFGNRVYYKLLGEEQTQAQ